jgi:hypothetical protein
LTLLKKKETRSAAPFGTFAVCMKLPLSFFRVVRTRGVFIIENVHVHAE